MKQGTIIWIAEKREELRIAAADQFEEAQTARTLDDLYHDALPAAMEAEMAFGHWIKIVHLVEAYPIHSEATLKIREYLNASDDSDLDPLQYGFDEAAREALAPVIRELLDRLTD